MRWPHIVVRPQKLGPWPLDRTEYEFVETRFRKVVRVRVEFGHSNAGGCQVRMVSEDLALDVRQDGTENMFLDLPRPGRRRLSKWC